VRARDTCAKQNFIRLPRANHIDPSSPATVVELRWLARLLMRRRFIDHTAAFAVLSLTAPADGRPIFAATSSRAP